MMTVKCINKTGFASNHKNRESGDRIQESE